MHTLLLAAALLAFDPNPEHEMPPSATDIAIAWIYTLRSGRAIPLSRLTAYPFSYREAWAKKRCGGVAADAERLARWVDCVREKEEPLFELLRFTKNNPGLLHLSLGTG